MMKQAARWLFREEKLPPRVLWWLTADGMRLWYRVLRWGLAPHLGGQQQAERALARLAVPVFQRRYEILRRREGSLPAEPEAVGLLMGALYLSPLLRESDWILAEVGGAPRGLSASLRAQRLLAPFDARARWEEVATHLGEVLIALTRGLPAAGLPNASSILGNLCFEAGQRYGRKMKRAYNLPDTPASVIEVLRMSEYLFRVNPEHWTASDPEAKTGFIEGTACPWYSAPGWGGMHCGIFGQFQSGISSVFGLRYRLTRTIPRHGGHICRIDLRPPKPGA